MTPNQPYQYYTAADIQRYLSGNMTAEEMYSLEKAALDDPLLAEAMEGYETAPAGWEAQLADLQQQFEQKTKTIAPVVAMKPTPPFRWWKVAAAVLILVTGGTLIYQALVPSGKSNSPAIADIKTEQRNTPTIPSDQAPTIASADPANPSSPKTIGQRLIRLPRNKAIFPIWIRFEMALLQEMMPNSCRLQTATHLSTAHRQHRWFPTNKPV